MSEFSDQLRKKAAETRASEDFARFSDAQLDAWQSSYDPNSGRFWSEGAPGHLVDKPTECPHGTTLHGSKCISWEQANQMFGGGYGDMAAPAQAQAAPMGWGSGQQQLAGAMMPWQQPNLGPTGNHQSMPEIPQGGVGLPQVLQPYQGQSSATQGLLAGAMAPKQATQSSPMGLGTGWNQGVGGLTPFMQLQQRKQGVGGGGWWT